MYELDRSNWKAQTDKIASAVIAAKSPIVFLSVVSGGNQYTVLPSGLNKAPLSCAARDIARPIGLSPA
jgi:hypothetical protein